MLQNNFKTVAVFIILTISVFMQKKTADHKYLQIAAGIEKQISDETLKIGDKLPSIRRVSEENGISAGTAFQAYYYLESKGLIESRPQSGYYVRFTHRRFPAIPNVQPIEPFPSEISVQDMVSTVFKNLAANDVLNFSVGSPAIELLPAAKLNKSIIHAVRQSQNNCLAYEDVEGNLELRKQIAKLSLNWNGRIKANDIIVTTGCMEALVMCLKAVIKPGDTVATESPTFFGIFQALESLGLKVIELPTTHQGVDLKTLEKFFKKKKIQCCLFVPNFNNPLGISMPDSKKKELVNLVTRYEIPLIEDDIYGELYFGKQRPKTCKTYDREGWVLQCSSFSKSLAPGYRIGWCVPGRFTKAVKKVKLTHTVTSTTVTQVALAHFLSIGRYNYHLKSLRKALHTQSLKYVQGILAYFPEDVKVSRPGGGFVLWIEFEKNVDCYKLYQEAIKNNISIAPGNIFSAQGQYKNYIRLNFGKPYDHKVENGIKTIGDLAKKLSKKI